MKEEEREEEEERKGERREEERGRGGSDKKCIWRSRATEGERVFKAEDRNGYKRFGVLDIN